MFQLVIYYNTTWQLKLLELNMDSMDVNRAKPTTFHQSILFRHFNVFSSYLDFFIGLNYFGSNPNPLSQDVYEKKN